MLTGFYSSAIMLLPVQKVKLRPHILHFTHELQQPTKINQCVTVQVKFCTDCPHIQHNVQYRGEILSVYFTQNTRPGA